MVQSHEYPNRILLEQVRQFLKEGHTVTLRVRGVSMRPFLDNQDKVLLSPIEKKVKRGDVILAEVGEGVYVLHRVIKIKGDTVVLMGDGNLRGVECCHHKDILGVVTCVIYDTYVWPCKSLRWKVYSKLWKWLLPIRVHLLSYYKKHYLA